MEVKQLMKSGYVNVTWDVKNTGGYPIQEFILHASSPQVYYPGGDEGTMLLEPKHMVGLVYQGCLLYEMYKLGRTLIK